MVDPTPFHRNIPEPALRRLPWYLAYVKLLKKQGESYVSSTQIAKKINVSPTQIAKDLSYVNISGKTRVGYEIDQLINVLEEFLGFRYVHKAVLFGVGSLGAALLADSGLEQYGLKILAGFDVKDAVVNTMINHIPVYHANEFVERNTKTIKAEIGVLTVPADIAQQTADFLIEGGIRGIWNFTPFRIRVPEGIVLQNTSIYAHLAVMFNRLKQLPE
ncbi:redox-sensing transcriptional repressor Rex [Anaerorudis cellulosivorans]|uniref:redox-sensing transcriptional repressor Rex n=1 Tax=Anaerorudis cellulosivorans TaxID=3397862 RepID=UPI00221F7B00|nr:redox-sensing transcriptional repressor Rex [Seramator thermalis]MCW1735031.1 redox-sensing transcriptional repressor Rex [Seramator thermalis]